MNAFGSSQRAAGVIIRNFSKSDLTYLACGNQEGKFVSHPEDAFKGDSNRSTTIKTNHIGVFIHTEAAISFVGLSGYISFKMKTAGKEWIICVVYHVPSVGSQNATNVEIRSNEGRVDEFGRFLPGVAFSTVSGVVEDCVAAAKIKYSRSSNIEYQTHNQTTSDFKVSIEFNN